MKQRKSWSITLMLVMSFAWSVAIDARALQSANKKLSGYDIVQVEAATVEKGKETEDFPAEYGVVLQQNAVTRLTKKKIFNQVIDSTVAPVEPQNKDAKRLTLLSEIIEYKKGSRAKRYLVGFGAGSTKVKVRFTFRDAATGEELLRTEREGSFAGVFSFAGGGKAEAAHEAVGDVLDGLIKDILKNR
jgi:hypothetical protein